MISRRDLLKLSGLVGLAPSFPAFAQDSVPPDYKIEIAALTLELSPRRSLRTIAYNGQVPGPLLRFSESQAVTIEVTNRTDRPEVVHWHGLFLPPDVDGAMDEGTKLIAPNTSARYIFTPRPTGFRWYHTHTMAMGDLTRAQYGGQHGFLMIEARDNSGRYDQEFFLALHDWDGHLVASDDGTMNPSYNVAAINGKMMGFGEPLRVRQGQRILLHILNSSPTEVHWIALAGHTLRVVALDGNAVPTQQTVPMLRLAPAERVCALVEMNNPGVWVLGSTDDDDRNMGMGVVIEYQNSKGEPQWTKPTKDDWAYATFAKTDAPKAPDEAIKLTFEKIPGGRGGYNRWTINGKSWPDTDPLFTVQEGKRYRLLLNNNSGDVHPVHTHRHTFEVTKVGDKSMSGLMKDTLSMPRYSTAEIDFIADDPGPTFFHCHHQDHMDEGFAGLITYS